MTTGQRVAQKRKELGLSQEALGEKLGVSRQSIYKWESDSALPEIEKLVALSRLFGVSVGWLLGVEEESAPGEPELTEAQLKMVEEIAARYAPRPRLSPRRLAVVKVSVAVAVLCLCGVLWGFYRKMDRLNQHYYFLQADITEVQQNLDTQIASVSDRMETLFREQNTVIADYGTSLLNVDLSANSASFQVYAVPRNYMEGMTAEFYEANSSRSWVFNAKEEPGQRFQADLTCGLMENITLCVTFGYPDGTKQTQILDTYHGLYGQTFPDVRADIGLNQREVPGGLLLSGPQRVYLDYGPPGTESAVPVADIQSVRVGLFKNRKLVDWAVFQATEGVDEETDALTRAQWTALDNLRNHGRNGIQGYQLLLAVFPNGETTVEPGDILEPALVIQDIYGRTAVRAWRAYGLDETQGVLVYLDREAPDAYPDGWTLADGSPICS